MLDEELLAATEEACQREPLLARTRMALLRVEKEAHREGWDAPPSLWNVEQDPVRHFVQTRRAYGLTKVLMRATELCDGSVSEGLMRTALTLELARDSVGQESAVPRSWDLLGAAMPSSRFYGFAFMCEMWTTAEMTPSVAVAASAHRLHQHPDRVEIRLLSLAARDGLVWWVRRERRQPAQAVMWRPESDHRTPEGLVGHALARMTAAMVGNVVPVPPLAFIDEEA